MSGGVRLRALLVALAVLLAGCAQGSGIMDAGAAPTGPSAQASPSAPAQTFAASSEAPTAPSDDATADHDGRGGEDTQDEAAGGSGGNDGSRTSARSTTTVSVYFTRAAGVAAVRRVVPRVARIGSAAIEQLLAGPTATEVAAGYGTHIPDGTRLRDLAITDGVAVVDLSSEFDAGASTFGLSLRLAQVACTLDAFPTVDGVRFAVDGQVVGVFSGDGQVTDEPVSCSDYTETDPGAITAPTDTPS